MDARSIILKKREGLELTPSELEFMVSGFVSGAVPDYQMSAWLMSVLWRGMSEAETHKLTDLMLTSGTALDPAAFPCPSADKHSTGGVGDKVSLCLAPLVAAAGLCVPMISGRGLGHTGGTLDKLESLKGLRTDLRVREFVGQVRSVGCCIAAQTSEMAPADGAIYALRDVTGTVESVPLIVSSIVSKKIAEGAGCLVFDVKWGGGAFMREMDDALDLAAELVRHTERFGRKAAAFVTDMNQPLGIAVGNALELAESVNVLRGRGPADLTSLTLLLGGAMLDLAGAAASISTGEEILRGAIESGAALEKFNEMIEAQGGDPAALEEPSLMAIAPRVDSVCSGASGYVRSVDARGIGALVREIGGGRLRAGDRIDHSVGLLALKKEGDRVNAGEPLAELHLPERVDAESYARRASALFEIAGEPPQPRPLVAWVVTGEGRHEWGVSP